MKHVQNSIENLKFNDDVLKDIIQLKETTWLNPNLSSINSLQIGLKKDDLYRARDLWRRFQCYLKLVFPELNKTNGIIESDFIEINSMKNCLNKNNSTKINNIYLKCDHDLPIAGSIKARGGFYEVLHYAETLAIEAGILSPEDSYDKFASQEFKRFFNQYSIGVGSTGNLGISVGIIGTALGFNVTVHMSADAKEWKQELLREKGVFVHKYVGDFSKAISEGRRVTQTSPKGYFIDDENSELLFLGYSTAAFHLKEQLEEKNIVVDENNPLFLYLPCGVGGSPGGITFGIKHILGNHVHCFFAEPTHSPSTLIGLSTGEKEDICVHDLGIDNLTVADGLAVGRSSRFATDYNNHLVSGVYTIEDNQLFRLLTMLVDSEKIFVEPSATAGFSGPEKIMQSSYLKKHRIKPNDITHVVWSTGGLLIPNSEKKLLYQKG